MPDLAPSPAPSAPSDIQLLEQAHEGFTRLQAQVHQVIIGQDAIVRPILAAVFAQGHTLIVGVPGLAKTLLVKTVAQVLNWSFKRIQFTPDMMPGDIIGMELLQEDPVSKQRVMRFIPGPVFANMILADEINRTPPKTQSALLEAMQEYHVTSMGHSYPLERPFLVFATQNPIEQEGTYPLPEAQLDRFMFSLWMDYPSAQEEREIVMDNTHEDEPANTPMYKREQVMAFQHLVRRVPASQHVVDYAVQISRATRPQSSAATRHVKQFVEWGAGPRASQHMILAAKALAVLDGQSAVAARHVREAAPLVLRHRVLPNYAAMGEGVTPEQIVSKLLAEVAEPMYGGAASSNLTR